MALACLNPGDVLHTGRIGEKRGYFWGLIISFSIASPANPKKVIFGHQGGILSKKLVPDIKEDPLI